MPPAAIGQDTPLNASGIDGVEARQGEAMREGAAVRRVVIMGAAGRDFHTFLMLYRDDPAPSPGSACW